MEISSRKSIGFADIILALATGVDGVLAFKTGAFAAIICINHAIKILSSFVSRTFDRQFGN